MTENYQIKKLGEYCQHCQNDNSMPPWTPSNTRICNVCGEREVMKVTQVEDVILSECGCAFGEPAAGRRPRIAWCEIHDPQKTNKLRPPIQYIAILNSVNPERRNRQFFAPNILAAQEWAGRAITDISDTVSIFRVSNVCIQTVNFSFSSMPAKVDEIVHPQSPPESASQNGQ